MASQYLVLRLPMNVQPLCRHDKLCEHGLLCAIEIVAEVIADHWHIEMLNALN